MANTHIHHTFPNQVELTTDGMTGESTNWDTKWDACDVDIEEERYGELNELQCFTAEFETAWSPPEAICHALREMFPDVSIHGL